MKKNLLKKASVYFINFLVVLMIVVLPVATVQAASQIETPIETRSKQNSNLEGGGDLSYIREPLKTPVEHLERQIYL